MCGIVGFINHYADLNKSTKYLQKMTSTIKNRGPDDSGIWISQDSRVGLGHRRLSILGLGSEGCQPMVSESKRYVIVFNGEIYNFHNLTNKLKSDGCSFSSRNDTAIFLKAIDVWGLNKTLKMVVGMYAFSLWDQKKENLILCRDRFGEKPLYYGWIKNNFLFGC